ncbi:MAG: polysaccharide deacetylase family protein [Acidimicrobiales bacterium]
MTITSRAAIRRGTGSPSLRGAALLVAAALLVVLSPPASADPAPITIGAHAAVPTLRLGLSTSAVGTVSPAGALGKVILQRQVGSAWLDRASGTADPTTGAFKIIITPSELGHYVMRIRSTGGSVLSNTFALDVVPPPTISARASTGGAPLGGAVTISGEVKPAGATSRVVSQRLVDGKWVDREAATPDAAGRYSLVVHPSEVARYRMRVRSSQGSIASNSVGFTGYTTWVNDVYDTGGYKGKKVVALTFDDGPSPTYTPQVLDILKKYGIKATFFQVGQSITYWPEVSRRVVQEGHRLANHSWNHPQLTHLSDAEIRSQIQRTQDQIAKVGGSSICVRPPYGDQNQRVRNDIAGFNASTIMWNTDPGDWQGFSASTIVSRTLSQIQPGSIIVLHDGGSHRASTVQALAQLIPALQARGYGFATIC